MAYINEIMAVEHLNTTTSNDRSTRGQDHFWEDVLLAPVSVFVS